jgi:hypothetical protein
MGRIDICSLLAASTGRLGEEFGDPCGRVTSRPGIYRRAGPGPLARLKGHGPGRVSIARRPANSTGRGWSDKGGLQISCADSCAIQELADPLDRRRAGASTAQTGPATVAPSASGVKPVSITRHIG